MNAERLSAEDHRTVHCENVEDEPTYAEPADYCLDGTAPPNTVDDALWFLDKLHERGFSPSRIAFIRSLISEAKPKVVTRAWWHRFLTEVQSGQFAEQMLREIGVNVADGESK
jgi:hypothetical protein